MIIIVNGTNISRATSFVKSIDEKKTIMTRKSDRRLMFPAFLVSDEATDVKSPELLNPSDTPMRQKRSASVRKSTALIHSPEGGLKNDDSTAAASAITNTISDLMNFNMILIQWHILLSVKGEINMRKVLCLKYSAFLH